MRDFEVPRLMDKNDAILTAMTYLRAESVTVVTRAQMLSALRSVDKEPAAMPTIDEIDEIRDTVERIKPILAGLGSSIQGAALADCLAMWLAGHQVDGDERATWMLRGELLAVHLYSVGQLVSVNAKIIGTIP